MNILPNVLSVNIFKIYEEGCLNWNDYFRFVLVFSFIPIDVLISIVLCAFGHYGNSLNFVYITYIIGTIS